MTSIDPSREPVFIIKVLRNKGSKLEDRKNYREINIKGNAWGRLFVHKDQVKEYGGLRSTTDYVRKVLSRIPVTDDSEIKITFKHLYLLSNLKEDSRGIKSRPTSSSSSSSSPPISSSSSSSSSQVAAPTPDFDAKITSLLEAKRNLVLKNFNDQTLGFSKKNANQLLDSIDKNELFQSGVDELVNLMFKKVLVNLIMQKPVFSGAVRANIEHIVSRFPLDLKSQTQTIDDVVDFGDFLTGIENRLVKKVRREICNFKPTESPDQSLKNEDRSYIDLYNHKKSHLLTLLTEQSPFMDPIKHASYSEICEGLTDEDIVLKSFDELRKVVNEKYKTFQSDSRKAVRLNLTSTKPQSSTSSSSQASSSYEARSSLSGKKIIGTFRPMRDLYYSKAEFVGDKYWIAAKNAFAELLLKPNAKKIEEGAPAIRDGNLLASYLHDLIETLPNDKIRSQDDLKAALKKMIVDCNTKEEHLDVNLFKQFQRSNLSNIRNTPEYENAIADLLNNQWPEGEERTFTFRQFEPKKLEDIIGSNGVVDTFFNHMYTTALLKRFWNLDK